ncbi:MAG: 2-isopropylmalate synthase [Lachnospiraceae bacterium]|nr:2-isopropylmalate synthase [Lachnospiraceae bacterium]
MLNYSKYRRNPVLNYPERQWPGKEIVKAPIWCSVDLRDGNQALVEPLVVSEKLEYFRLLVKLGFKEIEVGCPSASQLDFDFLRMLVDRRLIPADVTVQVLTQCREHLIRRTFEALDGIPQAIVHIYNPISPLHRDAVLGKSKEEVLQIALDGVRMVKDNARYYPGKVILEYSPEDFTGTEMEYALEVCEAVQEEWGTSPDNKIIINLPATVEMNTPNVYADQIEWMGTHFKKRDEIILSVHPHNDRGTGIAAAELALLAGADRVEGTLLGNGERTGNVDICTLAYNMFSQGVNPGLNLENVNEIVDVFEHCCKMKVGERHPYAGQLVFTAFSGSHQDAINKGMKVMREHHPNRWQVPYLPIDPSDVGRVYEPIVRINSQSGKGGVIFVMESYFGFRLPKEMQKEFVEAIQLRAEEQGEVSSKEVYDTFNREYLNLTQPFELIHYEISDVGMDTNAKVEFSYIGAHFVGEGIGNGPLDAIKTAVMSKVNLSCKIDGYTEHALTYGSRADAAAYIQLMDLDSGRESFGVGVSSNITRASVRAFFSALNRVYGKKNKR